uniref:N-myc and STAT interactor n=1 Tax=Calidris pygmaea TaxID=425635 RepID=A0A8C3JLR1_9CHAR
KQENAELKREIEKLKQDLAECSSALAQDGQVEFEILCNLSFGSAHFYFVISRPLGPVIQLIKMGKHTVNLDSKTADVSVMPFTLEMGIKFELHVTISGTKINVSEVPELPIPEDWMRDKLELNFYKPEQGGGGEVEDVSYDRQSRTAIITFLRPGANGFVSCTKYPFFANGRCYRLPVFLNTNVHLEKFQLYCGVSKKTILLKGIQETEDDEESVQDMIEIHFQKPSNCGGEIENIKYVSKGITWVCFEEDI